MKFCDGIDPFSMSKSNAEAEFPLNINYLDIMKYVIDGDSHYTENTFKSYKSLSAYKLYQAGWVQEAYGTKTSIGYIVTGSVCQINVSNIISIDFFYNNFR